MSQDVQINNDPTLSQKTVTRPVLLAMGGNIFSEFGAPDATIWRAIEELKGAGFNVIEVSRLYQTPAFPAESGPDFVNASVLCESDLAAEDMLARLLLIEKGLGRVRSKRWGARPLDIDLLAVADVVSPDLATFEYWRRLPLQEQATRAPDELVLPHPRLHERGFVLVPLADVAANWRHPVLGQTVAEMLAELPQSALAGIEPLQTL